jgi:hypothetical protein
MLLTPKSTENSCEIYRVMERLTIHRKLDIVESDPAGDLLIQDRGTVSVHCYMIQMPKLVAALAASDLTTLFVSFQAIAS